MIYEKFTLPRKIDSTTSVVLGLKMLVVVWKILIGSSSDSRVKEEYLEVLEIKGLKS